jgi:hypothetical protein
VEKLFKSRKLAFQEGEGDIIEMTTTQTSSSLGSIEGFLLTVLNIRVAAYCQKVVALK